MIFFGHVGITVGVTQLINERYGTKADLRAAAFFAVFPDIIDKPIGLLFSDTFERNTRLMGHSLLFLALWGLILWLLRRRTATPLFWWGAYLGHMLLDRLWIDNWPAVFWPFLPRVPVPIPIIEHWQQAFSVPYNVIGEAVGLIFLFALVSRYRLFHVPKFAAFLRSGQLTRVPAS